MNSNVRLAIRENIEEALCHSPSFLCIGPFLNIKSAHRASAAATSQLKWRQVGINRKTFFFERLKIRQREVYGLERLLASLMCMFTGKQISQYT